jgi:hypothetical protein
MNKRTHACTHAHTHTPVRARTLALVTRSRVSLPQADQGALHDAEVARADELDEPQDGHATCRAVQWVGVGGLSDGVRTLQQVVEYRHAPGEEPPLATDAACPTPTAWSPRPEAQPWPNRDQP